MLTFLSKIRFFGPARIMRNTLYTRQWVQNDNSGLEITSLLMKSELTWNEFHAAHKGTPQKEISALWEKHKVDARTIKFIDTFTATLTKRKAAMGIAESGLLNYYDNRIDDKRIFHPAEDVIFDWVLNNTSTEQSILEPAAGMGVLAQRLNICGWKRVSIWELNRSRVELAAAFRASLQEIWPKSGIHIEKKTFPDADGFNFDIVIMGNAQSGGNHFVSLVNYLTTKPKNQNVLFMPGRWTVVDEYDDGCEHLRKAGIQYTELGAKVVCV